MTIDPLTDTLQNSRAESLMPVQQKPTVMKSMNTFETVADAAVYFKKCKVTGSTCLLTRGPQVFQGHDRYNKVRYGFYRNGVCVTVQGEYGGLTITLRGFSHNVQMYQREYLASKRVGEQHCLRQSVDKLQTIGAAVYVEGNGGYIRKKLRRRFGAGSCSVNLHGNGWRVTRNR